MEITYAERLTLLHALCTAENLREDQPKPNLSQLNALDSADYLSCYVTFNAIHTAERQPSIERMEHFDGLSVYQAFALLVYAFFSAPLSHEGIMPNFQTAQISIAKTLFAGLFDAELLEIIESGFHKFKLIAEAETEHWLEFRENLDKVTISLVVAATDDDSPHDKADILPIFGQLLSQLCEAFERD